MKIQKYARSFTFESRSQALKFIAYCNKNKIRCNNVICGNRTVFYDGTYKQAMDFKKNNKEK